MKAMAQINETEITKAEESKILEGRAIEQKFITENSIVASWIDGILHIGKVQKVETDERGVKWVVCTQLGLNKEVFDTFMDAVANVKLIQF